MNYRENCYRCFLAKTKCICNKINEITSLVQVIILQHSKENKKAIGTAKIVSLTLKNSMLIKDTDFKKNKTYQKLRSDPNRHFYLLYPDKDATMVEDINLDHEKKNSLLVIDGTWSHAFKIFKEIELPINMTKIKINPTQFSQYKIRTQPNNKCLSTVESVVHTLEALEKRPNHYQQMINTFHDMINEQIVHYPPQHLKNRKAYKKEVI